VEERVVEYSLFLFLPYSWGVACSGFFFFFFFKKKEKKKMFVIIYFVTSHLSFMIELGVMTLAPEPTHHI